MWCNFMGEPEAQAAYFRFKEHEGDVLESYYALKAVKLYAIAEKKIPKELLKSGMAE